MSLIEVSLSLLGQIQNPNYSTWNEFKLKRGHNEIRPKDWIKTKPNEWWRVNRPLCDSAAKESIKDATFIAISHIEGTVLEQKWWKKYEIEGGN